MGYKSVIDIKKGTPKETLISLLAMADKAFDNHAGKIQNTSLTPYRFVYEGGEKEFGCLEVGMLNLEEQKNFLRFVSSQNWIDEEEPGENCDILQEIKKHLFVATEHILTREQRKAGTSSN